MHLGADLSLAGVVGLVRVGLEVVDEGLAVEAVAAAGLALEVLVADADRVDGAQRGPQRVEVPLLGEVLGGGGDVAGDELVDHRADLLVQVGALEDLAALAVDDLALPAHHVVVLEDVLAGLEVERLDLALRDAIDLVTDLFSIGWSSGTRSAEQHPLDPVGLEQPHQVVAEGEVEPGLARVALTAGTTAQLVVDAARLVALGAQDVEPAELGDLVVLGLDLRGRCCSRVAGQAAL